MSKSIITSAPTLDLSIVVPAYRCLSIDQDLREIFAACNTLSIHFEIICIVDGRFSSTDTTQQLAESVKLDELRVFSYSENQGKGYAVRFGMEKAQGKVIGFIDAGHDINPQGIVIAYQELINNNGEIVIGNKRDHFSRVNVPFIRQAYSYLLKLLIRIFFQLEVTDTQVGLKLFSRTFIKKVLPLLTINRWAFDVEILAFAKIFEIKKIIEVPIQLTYNGASNVTTQAIFSFFYEFILIFWRLKILRKLKLLKKNKSQKFSTDASKD